MEDQIYRGQSFATASLYDAAFKGDVNSLIELLERDPLILDRSIIERTGRFVQSPLQVAVNMGHLDFTREILRRKPELADDQDIIDQSTRSPSLLHLASMKGHLEIVTILLTVKPNLCFSRDQDGRNPVHVAAMNGQIHVLDMLLRANSQAAWERTNSGETALHLCVKHRQFEALKFLSKALDDQLLSSRNNDGNTILHLAVSSKQPEMVNFILKSTSTEVNAINTNGLTAMDTHIQSRKDLRDEEIIQSLRHFKGSRAKDVLKPPHRWVENQRNALMVVASLIATMAFQVGINPPGGAWQDDQNTPNTVSSTQTHVAGSSIMAHNHKGQYNVLILSNTVGLISSLSVILLLISGLPCRKLFVGILMITMWIAVSTTAVTYLISICFLSLYIHSSQRDRAAWFTLDFIILTWLLLMVILLLGHGIRFVTKLIRKQG